MKKYICTKTVMAEPMDSHTAGKAGLIRDWNPDSKNTGGYKVRYIDGYESWSPKAAFETGYVSLKTI